MLMKGIEGLGDPCEILLDRLKGRTPAKPRAGAGPWRMIRRV